MPEPFEGRCFSCREKVAVEKGYYRETQSGGGGAKVSGPRGQLRGRCPWCGNTVFKLVPLRRRDAATNS